MVPGWRRLLYSAASVGGTAAACDLAICLRSEYVDASHHNARFALNSSTGIAYFVSALFGAFRWVLLFCIPGWILAFPIVFLARNLSGLRFWIWWAAGTCVGPAIMFGVAYGAPYILFRSHSYQEPSHGGVPTWSGWFSLATGVACVATLLFLLLLRREQGRLGAPD
jgi:hypothetical protein